MLTDGLELGMPSFVRPIDFTSMQAEPNFQVRPEVDIIRKLVIQSCACGFPRPIAKLVICG